MAGMATEGTQYDPRQFDSKMNVILGEEGQETFYTTKSLIALTPWNSDLIFSVVSMPMVLRSLLLFSREESSHSAKGLDVIQQAQSGTGKTATFCSGVLQQLDYTLLQCQALLLAPTRELAQQIEKVMRALGDYLGVSRSMFEVSTCIAFSRLLI